MYIKGAKAKQTYTHKHTHAKIIAIQIVITNPLYSNFFC